MGENGCTRHGMDENWCTRHGMDEHGCIRAARFACVVLLAISIAGRKAPQRHRHSWGAWHPTQKSGTGPYGFIHIVGCGCGRLSHAGFGGQVAILAQGRLVVELRTCFEQHRRTAPSHKRAANGRLQVLALLRGALVLFRRGQRLGQLHVAGLRGGACAMTTPFGHQNHDYGFAKPPRP